MERVWENEVLSRLVCPTYAGFGEHELILTERLAKKLVG